MHKSNHDFILFSRKVSEAASIRRPVDVQLGLASGKFDPFSNLRPRTRQAPPRPIDKSYPLARLVTDVLKHMDSCPNRIAYSVELDTLRPKLEAYIYNGGA